MYVCMYVYVYKIKIATLCVPKVLPDIALAINDQFGTNSYTNGLFRYEPACGRWVDCCGCFGHGHVLRAKK